MPRELPKVIEKSQQEIDGYLDEIKKSALKPATIEFTVACIELATWLPNAIQEHKITIRQLQKLIFGSGKANKNNQSTPPSSAKDTLSKSEASNDSGSLGATAEADIIDNALSADEPAATPPTKPKGHGRKPRSAYLNATHLTITHETLTAGTCCPSCETGKVYRCLVPGALIRVVGQPMAAVFHLDAEKLRCSTCGDVFTAALPARFCDEKYDPYFKALLVVQKYFMGVPFHRQAFLQSYMGFFLAASVQFELSEQVADCSYPVVKSLERLAANGTVIANDDTHVKILSVIKDNKATPTKSRTGTYTSCILGSTEEHTIALYYSGVHHAGENLGAVLQLRQHEEPIIQMCDALSANIPKGIKTILCNCLSHGVRKFKELLDFYPEPCLYVISILGKVFEHDAATKGLTVLERFHYHRQHSKPLMLELHRWLKRQFREKRVEPNSALGKAIKYLLKHWKKLRTFLVVPGAPIDNNIVERALKIPIRVRKTAMFYKTEHGAKIASILMTLIHTAILANENPVDYLTTLQENKSHVFKEPTAWVPWRYRATLAELKQCVPAVHSQTVCANQASPVVRSDHPDLVRSVI